MKIIKKLHIVGIRAQAVYEKTVGLSALKNSATTQNKNIQQKNINTKDIKVAEKNMVKL